MKTYDQMSFDMKRVCESAAEATAANLRSIGMRTAGGEFFERLREAIAVYVAESATASKTLTRTE